MKKSSFDFSQPSRQSYAAIFLIILKTYRIIVRQAWPFLVIFLLRGQSGSSMSQRIAMGLAVMALVGMVIAIINFFRFYFYIEKGELIIESGVLQRKRLSVPLDRVQAVNLESNILHQVLGVVGLEIDTAGSSKTEFKFDAISRAKAEALQEVIMSYRKSSTVKEASAEDGEKRDRIFTLGIFDLLKVGITQNHIRSGWAILIFFFWIYQNLEEVGLDMDQYGEQISGLNYTFWLVGVLVALFMSVAFVVSLVRTVVRDYGLTLDRVGKSYKLRRGLFTKKDFSALDQKIQVVSWGDNLLMRLIGIFNLSIQQASSVVVNTRKSIKVPGLDRFKIEKITEQLYGPDPLDGMAMQRISPRWLYRRLTYLCIIAVAVLGLAWYLKAQCLAIIMGIVWLYIGVSSILVYRKIRWGHNGDLLYLRGGTFGDKHTILPLHKVQAVSKHSNIYQRRHDLASIEIHSASGSLRVPYIPLTQAHALFDYLTYKVESDRRPWM